MDTKLYNIVKEYAKKAVLNNHLPIQFDDLVNDAYIKLVETNQSINSDNWIKCMNSIALEHGKNKYSNSNEKEVSELQTSFCRCCKEDKPIACFGITIRKKTNKKVVQSYCSECQRLKMIEHRRAKGIPEKPVIEYPADCITDK